MTFKVIQGQVKGQEMTSVPYRDYFLFFYLLSFKLLLYFCKPADLKYCMLGQGVSQSMAARACCLDTVQPMQLTDFPWVQIMLSLQTILLYCSHQELFIYIFHEPKRRIVVIKNFNNIGHLMYRCAAEV